MTSIQSSKHDLIVVGGGITGAGIFKEACARGLKVLLLEARDFASGTSSKSSKMVHGGLRYLQYGHVKLTRQSVQEREKLLQEAPGLVNPLGFLMAVYQEKAVNRWLYGLGLGVYDTLAGQWQHQYHNRESFRLLAPHLRSEGLLGGYQYTDAQTDDARLVLRLLQEGQHAGGTALNHAPVTDLLQKDGQVTGVTYLHPATRQTVTAMGPVIHATGAASDLLRKRLGQQALIRPLRGSHLVIPHHRLPTLQAIAFQHPTDGRNVFVHPWHGHVLIGTTDVDHTGDLLQEPSITRPEFDYLLNAARFAFPDLELTERDVTGCWAGVRPVVASGQEDPSKEAREHLVLAEKGMITVTGGKLTTFRVTAQEALHLLSETHGIEMGPPTRRIFDEVAPLPATSLPRDVQQRIEGHYGREARRVLQGDLTPVPGTLYLWSEVQQAASEQVGSLSDLMLRRLRLGFYLRDGGQSLLPELERVARPVLGWSQERWKQEVRQYLSLWKQHYGRPHETPAVH